MTDAELVALAADLAGRLHASHVDHLGAPYAGHLERVAAHAAAAGADAITVAAAYLHDSIEDGVASVADLAAAGVPQAVIDVVVVVTRRTDELYRAFIDRIATTPDPVVRERAVTVKLADLADNTDPARSAALAVAHPAKARSLAHRYQAAITRLTR